MREEDEVIEEIEAVEEQRILASGAGDTVPLTSLLDAFIWFKLNLCQPEILDCRGHRIFFREEDFIHFIKLKDRYGREPKNRARTLADIKAGHIKFFHGSSHSRPNYELQRARDLVFLRSIIQNPWKIVRNWQQFGRANPGEVYIRKFGTKERPVYRVLICGLAGRRRIPITAFTRKHLAERDLARCLWP